jgi:predicted transposase YbfD/YdcC
MVSAWATGQRIVLGQQACEEKSNEITAIPLLLKNLDLKGALVTIDAMGTQTKIAQAIRDGGGDYILSLKENCRRRTRRWNAVQKPTAGHGVRDASDSGRLQRPDRDPAQHRLL